MAFVKVRIPRTSQPQDVCGIDSGSPLGSKVLFALPGGSGATAVGHKGRLGTVNGTVGKLPRAHGQTLLFNGASYLDFGAAPILADGQPFAIALNEEVLAASGANTMMGLVVGNRQFLWLRSKVSIPYFCALGVANGSAPANFSGLGEPASGERIRFVVSGSNISDSTTYRLWANGIELTRSTSTFGTTAASTNKIGWAGADIKWNGLLSDVVIFGDTLSDADVRSYLANPNQIFEPEELTIWVPDEVGAGGADHLVTAANSIQANTSSSATIAQTHNVTVAVSTQANTGSAASITQTHLIGAANAAQANTTTAGAVSQGSVTQVTPANSAQPNSASVGSITQTHLISAASSTSAHTSTTAAIGQTHLVSAAGSQQANAASSASVSQDGSVLVSAANSMQANTGSAGSISQTHMIVCAPVAVDNVASASSIVQTHLIGVASSAQGNRCSAGSVADGSLPPAAVAGALASGRPLQIGSVRPVRVQASARPGRYR